MLLSMNGNLPAVNQLLLLATTVSKLAEAMKCNSKLSSRASFPEALLLTTVKHRLSAHTIPSAIREPNRYPCLFSARGPASRAGARIICGGEQQSNTSAHHLCFQTTKTIPGPSTAKGEYSSESWRYVVATLMLFAARGDFPPSRLSCCCCCCYCYSRCCFCCT
ncbi:hypothetical protein B0T22DRAFT_270279 [Podospora appendiculata]|uniref:Uncharacterized protein n=1 Tax=Podospora appendiculata TaxID=314037 RepID=A0AAE1C9J8_9PEZI|nr:hypothetical protein B0T22DRAFT_270279 [Podospora appendiculata]